MNVQLANHCAVDDITKNAMPIAADGTYRAAFWNNGDQEEDGCQGSVGQVCHVPGTVYLNPLLLLVRLISRYQDTAKGLLNTRYCGSAFAALYRLCMGRVGHFGLPFLGFDSNVSDEMINLTVDTLFS